MGRSTIWIINEAGHSYNKALELIKDAELRPLTTGDVNPLAIDRMSSNLARGIVRYVKEDDYALIAGTPVLNAIAITLWILQHGRCKILQWNAKDKGYEQSEITRDNLEDMLEKELMRS